MTADSRTVADVLHNDGWWPPPSEVVVMLGIDPDMPYDQFRRRLAMGKRAEQIDATTPDTDWVTCGNGRTDDSIVTPSARRVVEWIGDVP